MRSNVLSTICGLSVVTATLVLFTGCGGSEKNGCSSDADCKKDRVCLDGTCVLSFEDAGSSDAGTDDDDDDPSPDAETDTRDDDDPPPPPPDDDEDAGEDTFEPPPSDTGVDTGTPDTWTPPRDTGPDVPPQPDAGTIGPQVSTAPPNELDFGPVTVGSSSTEKLVVRNAGDAPLTVTKTGLDQTPSQGFSVKGPSTPKTLSPGKTLTYKITFTPQQQSPFQNEFFVESNDSDPGDRRTEVTLNGFGFNKVRQACLTTSPQTIDFGVVPPGKSSTEEVRMTNCGTRKSVTVTAHNFLQNPNNAFNITSSSPQPPYKIAVNSSKKIKLEYSPSTKRTLRGRLSIRSDETTRGGDFIDLAGSGGGCPEADAKAKVPKEKHDLLRDGPVPVKPGKSVQLDGTESKSPNSNGKLTYNWSLKSKPSGSAANITSPSSAKTKLTPKTPGLYKLQLDVKNPINGKSGCVTDTVEVIALKKSSGLQATLSWGADHDMNVHLVRSKANGKFPNFRDRMNDVYPTRPAQNWGSSNKRTDDAFLLGDANSSSNSSNSGAERVLVGKLENNRDYRVALYFNDADGFRPARFRAQAKIDVRGSTQSLNHRFTVRDRNRYWITFEVDGATGQITKVDMKR